MKYDLYLYTDDTCLTFQHENVLELRKQFDFNYVKLCDTFIDNKLSIYPGEEKTKSIFFGGKFNIKKT